jgi:pre-mRNA 3'-end-processing factor FIP1
VPDVKPKADDGVDPSVLPPITAPPSHPAIDPTATGMLEGRPIYEVDIAALAEKAWRRPGSDISDWFNYGFDEISWEAYCYRRRELGDLAAVLKTNVVVRARVPSFFFSAKLILLSVELFRHA